MSKTLWNTIKIEVPNEMVNITKKDKVVAKKSLTKTNNVSKANKKPSIKIISGNVNKPKIISDGKEWNIEEYFIAPSYPFRDNQAMPTPRRCRPPPSQGRRA